jgi:hypothetical protein
VTSPLSLHKISGVDSEQFWYIYYYYYYYYYYSCSHIVSMAHKVRIPLLVKQLADKMHTALSSVTAQCCHRVQPRTGPFVLYCAATEQGPAQEHFVTVLFCQRTRPSKGVILGPNTEHFSYCMYSAVTEAFYYFTVLRRTRPSKEVR